MKKLLSLFVLLVAIVTGAQASTVSDLATLSTNRNVYFEDFMSAGLTAGTLYDSNYLLSVKANTYKTDQGTDPTINKKYCCRVKSVTQDVIAFKVGGACTLVLYASRITDRTPILNTEVSSTGDGVISGADITVGASGKSYGKATYTIPAAGTYYIIGSGSDCYLAGLEFTFAGAAKDYTVTAASNNNSYGTAAASASSLDEGETATITATAKAGYEFTSWAVEGTGATLSSTTTNPTTLTMGTANATVTATFSAINYTIAHNAATGGTYTISVAGGDATDANTNATVGQTITLAGTPTNPAHTYVAWNVTDANDAAVTVTNNQFTMPASNVTIAPVFSEPLNTIFSMTNITGIVNSTEDASKGTVTATISDGSSVEVFNNKGNADGLLYNNNAINLNGSGSSYIHVTFPSALQAGDVITATFLGGDDAWKLSKTTSGAANKSNPYTLAANDALIGATDLYIFKNGSAQVTALTIEGEGEISDLAVTSSTTPVVAIGAESTIEYTTSSTGAITFASSDESVATVSSEGVITAVEGGTATITINQAADETYRAGVAKVTVTVPEIALVKIKTLGGTSTKVTGTIDNVATAVTADVNLSSNRKMDKEKYVGFTLNGENSLKAGDIVEVNITAAGQNGTFKFYNNTSDEPTLLYDTEVAPDEAKTYRFVMPAEMEGVKTVYLRRGAENSGINEGFNPVFGYIAIYRPIDEITLNSNGYATYSSAKDFEFLGAKAYGMELTTTSLTGHEATGKIKAGEGILFKGEAGAKVYITETTGAEALTNNSLIGTTDADNEIISSSYTHKYALSGKTFKTFTGSLQANKAFFGTNEELSNSLDLVFDGDPTAVEAIAEANAANAEAPIKVIKNGKLYIGNYNVAGARIK